MKIQQKSIAIFLSGAIIGAVVVGLINSNKLQPLFSSADDYPPHCEWYAEGARLASAAIVEIDQRVEETGVPETESRKFWKGYYDSMQAGFQRCISEALLQ